MARRFLLVAWVLIFGLAWGSVTAQLAAPLRQDLQGFDQLPLAQQRQTLRSLLAAGNAAMQDPDAQQVLQRLLLRSIDTFLAHRDGLCNASTLFRLGDPALFPAAFGNTNGSDENLVLLIPASTTNWRGVVTSNNPGHIDNGPYRVPIDTIDTLLNNTLTDTWWHEANHTLLSAAGVGVQDPVCNQLRLNDRDAATSSIGMGCVADDDPPGGIGYHHPLIRGLGQLGLAAYDRLDRFQGALRKADEEEDALLKRAEPLDPERLRQIWSNAHREFSGFQAAWRDSLYSDRTVGPVTYGRLQPGFVRVYRNTVGTFFSPPQDVALAYQAGCIRVPEPTGEVRGIRPPKWVFEETLPLMPVRIDLGPQPEQRRGKAYRQTFVAQVRAKGSWLQPQVRGLADNFRYGLLQRGLLTVELSDADGKATLRLERKGETEPDSAYAPVAEAIPGTFQVSLDRRNIFRLTFEHPDTSTVTKDTSFTLRLYFEDTTGSSAVPQKVYDSAEALAFIDLTGSTKPAIPPPPPSSASGGQVPTPPAAPVRVKGAARVLQVRFDFFGDPGTWVATTPLVNIPNPAFPKTDLTWLIGVNGIDGSIDQQAPEWSNLQALIKRVADPMAQVRAQMAATYKQMGLDPATASQAIGAVTPFIGQFTQTYKLLDTGYQRVGRPVEIWAYLEPATLPGIPFPYQTQDGTGRPVTRSLEARLEILDWEFTPAVPPGKSLGLKDGIAGWTPPAPAGDPAAAAVPEDLYLDARIRFRMTLYDPASGEPYLEGGQPLTWDSLYRNVRLGLVYYPIAPDPGGVVVKHKDSPVPPEYEDEDEQEDETVDAEDEDDFPVLGRPGWQTVILEPLSYRVPPRTREERAPDHVVSCFQDIRPCAAAFGVIVSNDPAKALPSGIRVTTSDGEPASLGNIPARRYRYVQEGREWTLVRVTPSVQPLPEGEALTLTLFWRVEQGLGDEYKNLLDRVWETVRLGDIADPMDAPKGHGFRWLPADAATSRQPSAEQLKELEMRLWQSLIYARHGKATAQDFQNGLDAADRMLKVRPADEAIRKGRGELETLRSRIATPGRAEER